MGVSREVLIPRRRWWWRQVLDSTTISNPILVRISRSLCQLLDVPIFPAPGKSQSGRTIERPPVYVPRGVRIVDLPTRVAPRDLRSPAPWPKEAQTP